MDRDSEIYIFRKALSRYFAEENLEELQLLSVKIIEAMRVKKNDVDIIPKNIVDELEKALKGYNHLKATFEENDLGVSEALLVTFREHVESIFNTAIKNMLFYEEEIDGGWLF